MFAVRHSHGVFRDNEDWVRVRDSAGREIDMTKDSYVASRRSPPFEALPLAPSADRPLAAVEDSAKRRQAEHPSPMNSPG